MTITPRPATDSYFDLGAFHRPITTSSPDAQTWFDRGLCWIFGFHPDEALGCAEHALSHDPTSPMAHWLVAAGCSPNYARQWAIMGPRRNDALNRAKEVMPLMAKVASSGTPAEQALCEAIVHRFPKDENSWDFDQLNKAYAEAMGKVYAQFPDDLDIAALYADSLMCITPWKLWDLRTGDPLPNSRAPTARKVLDKALAQPGGNIHPGLLHMYIHLTEMSTTPEDGLAAADRLHGLIPEAGHLNHMPSHLYVVLGDYRRAISANARAIFDDELYVSKGENTPWYGILRLHNAQSLVYAAMGCGNYEWAIKICALISRLLTPEFVNTLPNMIGAFGGTIVHVYVRFGKWKEMLEAPLPDDTEANCVTTALYRYGRGLAYGVLGQVVEAEKERDAFQVAMRKIPDEYLIFPNQASQVVQVGEAMLDGEIEYRKGNYKEAFELLRESIRRYDGLIYGEPWSFMMDVRTALGALLLEQGHVQEAMQVYADDLGFSDGLPRASQHPNNVWALHGYHECLTKMGKDAEARVVYPQLRLALASADVKITSSCFCRLSVQDAKVDGKACCA